LHLTFATCTALISFDFDFDRKKPSSLSRLASSPAADCGKPGSAALVQKRVERNAPNGMLLAEERDILGLRHAG
jgi:hypothetical protein